MAREIRLNAFDMNCVGHQSPGLWAHPRDRSWQYKDLEYWTDLAKILERGKFDGLFIADVLGIYDVYNGNGDAAIRQAVFRRYEKVASGESVAPTLILIDGGKGQVATAASALEELGLSHLPMLGVAKGEGRKPGLETLVFADGREPVQLPAEHPALHLIQEIRDEAHRFAVSGHRAQRSKTRRVSRLDEIAGIGPKRRKALISHFGGLQGITNAGVDQLTAVPGISRELAETIYSALH